MKSGGARAWTAYRCHLVRHYLSKALKKPHLLARDQRDVSLGFMCT